jgi:hypothetical protein
VHTVATVGMGVCMPFIRIGPFIACAIARLGIAASAKFERAYLVTPVPGLPLTSVPWFRLP